MTEIEALEAKLEKTIAFVAAQAVAMNLLSRELEEICPGIKERVALSLRNEAELHPERSETSKEQFALVASIFEA